MRTVFTVALASLLALAACGDDPAAAPDAGVVPEGPRTVGGDRPVTVQVPVTLVAGERYPLVVVLHGYGTAGAVQQAYLQLAELTTTPGAFVVAPAGTVDDGDNQFWNASDACCDFADAAPDDVGYLGGIIDEIIAGWPIDLARVFVVGHSNGGFMAYRMACERADVITAIAPLAGANVSLDGAGCAPTAPVSILHLHGTADGTVAYGGGVLLAGQPPYPGAEASTQAWATADGCTGAFAPPAADATLDLVGGLPGAETAREVAGGCPAGVAVERWRIAGAGHIPDFSLRLGPALVDWLWSHPRP
ncbi:MAG: PHB depolymerase family esterase [Kofleriaceae bacterium]